MPTDEPRRSAVPAYLLAATLTRLAGEMLPLAVVWLVLDRGGGPGLAGATVAAYTLPAVVSGPVLGAWLDRTRHVRLVLAANQVLLAVAALGLLAWAGRSAPASFALAVLAGAASPMTSGGFSSLVPALPRRRPLAVVTAWDAATFNAAAIVGPALAGTLAATAGSGSAMTVSGLCAVAGLVGTAFLGNGVPARGAPTSTPTTAPPSAPPKKTSGSRRDTHGGAGDNATVAVDQPRLLASVVAGTRHLLRTPPLLGATVTTAVGFGSTGLLALAIPLHVERLGVEKGTAGWVWAVLEVGCAASTLLLARHLAARRPENVVFVSTAAYGLALLLWPLAPSLPVLLGAALLAGLVEGPTLPAVITARQRYTPPAMAAQVFTTGASLKIGAYALGAALGARLVPELGTTTTLVVVAVAQVVATAVGWFLARVGSAARGPSPVYVREDA
ncbi:putative arabinose efflux permease, MFS family [Streptoalloteichus tenebrarius]|uniref:Arabinose efflux permease, MFS family n=1 Tax=Streptoalloteichus tenebrarius (strain ATCC 17920 / DSM 40477 / JCM 4838 / CBS 697.72 / NBRC 16177 / NCIMB 11028 / NRRL B-12390 / A12253. 1 / ISP 5477) TaxID=1933 RepID=A0ABT1HQS7_STRSD|nr:MFS transporter [Streptoalloteichus tenebrarius]MCP2257875.1 putative arabinose efflux permease, MFS family [Streptoalloteichus tenebrarius]BFE99762.1 MFS transporter [Streptoalloteichus tenebrarius]